MRPNKPGQVVRFHTPLPDEDPQQLYVALEIIEDDERPRALIKALPADRFLPLINSVSLNDLEVVKVDTTDLIGHNITMKDADNSQASGKVIKTGHPKLMLELEKGDKGVDTNVWLTIEDKNGVEHTGTLFVN